jgi:hypothetical protein
LRSYPHINPHIECETDTASIDERARLKEKKEKKEREERKRRKRRKKEKKEREVYLFVFVFLFSFLKSGPMHTPRHPPEGGVGVSACLQHSRLSWKWDPCPELGPWSRQVNRSFQGKGIVSRLVRNRSWDPLRASLL